MVHHRKCRDITGSICNVNHIFKANSPVFLWDLGIDADIVQLQNPFVDFKNRTGFCGIVNGISNFADHRITLSIRFLDQFASPYPIHIRHQRRTSYHLCKAGADNIMLHLNAVLCILLIVGKQFLCLLKNLRNPGIKLQFLPKLPQSGIVQSGERTVLCTMNEMIQVNGIPIHTHSLGRIFVRQCLHLTPKRNRIYLIPFKNRVLHIAVHQRPVTVPDYRNYICH